MLPMPADLRHHKEACHMVFARTLRVTRPACIDIDSFYLSDRGCRRYLGAKCAIIGGDSCQKGPDLGRRDIGVAFPAMMN